MNNFPDLDAVTRDGEKVWAADKSLQTEFGGDKEAYLAYRRADAKGQVRVLVPQRVLNESVKTTARSSWLASQASRAGGISGGIF